MSQTTPRSSPAAATPDPTTSPAVGGGWAWGICWLMFASTVLNYMDRQSIALVGPQIRRVFAVDFEGFGWVLTAFSLSYALCQVPAGFVVDRFDTRRVYAGAVAFWSLAAIATAFAPVVGVLIATRALLGVGESFNWPCALKVTGAILPPKDRSLGNGIFNSGAAVGAVLTPLTVPLLASRFGWRWSFVAIGLLGFVWLAGWLFATRGGLVSRAEAATGAAPPANGPADRGLSKRAKVAFGVVTALAAMVVVLGYFRPAPMAVPLDRLRPSGTITLREWKVAEGDKVTRGETVLAELGLGTATGLLIAPEDGKVAELAVEPGAAIMRDGVALTLEDSAGRFAIQADAIRPGESARVVRKPVEPGDRVNAGDVLAEVELGGTALTLHADRAGSVSRFEAAGGDSVEPKETLAVLGVSGFDTKGHGLTGVWFGIALLMFGALAVARIVPVADLGESGWARRLGEVARMRRFWVLVLVTCSINVCWHFLVSWLPTYLQTDRRMTYLAGGLFSALPFVAADAGNLLGGAASRSIAGRGLEPSRARLRVMAVCALLVSVGAVVGVIPSGGRWDAAVIGLLAIMALGAAAFMANYFAFCQEVSSAHTGLIVGYLGGLGNLLAAGFYPVAGRIKDATGGFGPVFVVVGLLPFVGLAAIAIGWGRDRDSAAGTA